MQQKIQQEKLRIDERLRQLASPSRSYPPVKYQNPDQPSETWTGRGKQPRWLVAQLKLGKRIDDSRAQPQSKGRVGDRPAQSSR
nr:H-NS histone family protein [Bradyrhizobium lablabi]